VFSWFKVWFSNGSTCAATSRKSPALAARLTLPQHVRQVHALSPPTLRRRDDLFFVVVLFLPKSHRLFFKTHPNLNLPSSPTTRQQEDGSRDALEEFFRRIDTDGDRVLTRQEFASHFAAAAAGGGGGGGGGSAAAAGGKTKLSRQDTPPLPRTLALPASSPPATIVEGEEEEEEEEETKMDDKKNGKRNENQVVGGGGGGGGRGGALHVESS
jgi:hypothetical protein